VPFGAEPRAYSGQRGIEPFGGQACTIDRMHAIQRDLIELIRRSLATCGNAAAITSLPTFLLRGPGSPYSVGMGTAADIALSYYCLQGFYGDRTRARLSPHGYPGLLRDLSEPPSWVEVQSEDVGGDMSAAELRPLIGVAHEQNEELLLARRRAEFEHNAFVLNRVGGHVAPVVVEELSVDCFRRCLALARSLGEQKFWAVFDAVFPFDEFTVAEGAPDLLLWLPEEPGLWFFSEVKAPGDSLRVGQKVWLHEHWDLVCGHYAITVFE
jgi:hypothetical protein